jgi:hypothetical protein
MRRTDLLVVSIVTLVMTGAASGLTLPGLPTPPMSLPGPVDGIVNDVRASAIQKLADRRELRLKTLVRRHRDVLEVDASGAPIVRGELLAVGPTPDALARARAEGFIVLRETTLEGVDTQLVVLQPPSEITTQHGLDRLRKIDPAGTYDLNHLFERMGDAEVLSEPSNNATDGGAPSVDGAPVRVGLIDGGVATSNAAFRGIHIDQLGCDGASVPSDHGTAVAFLLAEQQTSRATATSLYAVDVYCGKPTGGAADSLTKALAMMVRERIAVVNVSLVGPPNLALEAVTKLMTARGYLIVAPVGNDGPAAEPLYPAAYPGVVGVTGVDAGRRALIEAARGPQVDFAARGSNVRAAGVGENLMEVRGTSFAAPVVAALLARELPTPDIAARDVALTHLRSTAIDLGARGRDPTYGDGLVGEPPSS